MKLEEIQEIMHNPKPMGWERAVELGMIDFCEWQNSVEQEAELAHFLHANYDLISKQKILFKVIEFLNSDDIIANKNETRDSRWFKMLAMYRENELKEMTKCFSSDEYNAKRQAFVYH